MDSLQWKEVGSFVGVVIPTIALAGWLVKAMFSFFTTTFTHQQEQMGALVQQLVETLRSQQQDHKQMVEMIAEHKRLSAQEHAAIMQCVERQRPAA